MLSWLFATQLATCLAMTGVIWFVQIVHYPLFRRVGNPIFTQYEAAHRIRTTWVLGPIMLAELGTAITLALRPEFPLSATQANWGLGLLTLIFLSTFAVQVPRHDELSKKFDEGSWRRLVNGNWIRTVLWTMRSVLLLSALVNGS